MCFELETVTDFPTQVDNQIAKSRANHVRTGRLTKIRSPRRSVSLDRGQRSRSTKVQQTSPTSIDQRTTKAISHSKFEKVANQAVQEIKRRFVARDAVVKEEFNDSDRSFGDTSGVIVHDGAVIDGSGSGQVAILQDKIREQQRQVHELESQMGAIEDETDQALVEHNDRKAKEQIERLAKIEDDTEKELSQNIADSKQKLDE
uniref:Uncharacterized protein n=1 Tax=Spongospora subterranea TaxID=70186 RepID=A0A0H5QMA9_9EUKA|eukprot:CRZ02712.1 hypothetical protein [Spongospora subterranea]